MDPARWLRLSPHLDELLELEPDEESLVALPSAALGRMYAVQGNFGRAAPLLRRAQSIVLASGDWAEWASTGAMLGMSIDASQSAQQQDGQQQQPQESKGKKFLKGLLGR